MLKQSSEINISA